MGLKFPDICLTGEGKPRKNLTQETYPDRGSNPGSLRDRRARYRLFHSGDIYKEPTSPYNIFLILIFNELFKFKTSDEWQH